MMNKLGLYIHIPFCASKCSYCDFYSFAANDSQIDEYIKALIKEIKSWSERCKQYVVDTVYFGGGTPSLIGGERLAKIIKTIYNSFNVQLDAEITVECNPDSINEDLLLNLKKVNVNRLSIGVQAMQDDMLKSLSRSHTALQAKQVVKLAKKHGFNNISLDLMYALPNQTIDMVLDSLNQMLELEPVHLSCYALKVEEGTPLAKQNPILPDEDISADMYNAICETLKKHGFEHYEISNWAKSGYYSRHNSRYWDLSEYLGIGSSAHSLFNGKRFEYSANINDFILGVKPIEEEHINGFGQAEEFIMLALRTSKGINSFEYEQKFNKPFKPIAKALKKYMDYGFVQNIDNTWNFTEKGFLVSNTILSDVLTSVE